MSPRGRRLTAALAVLVALLFAGRWAASALSDRWWAAQFSADAAAWIGELYLLRLVLDLAGVLAASAWFVVNLLVVYRAVGTVEIPRHVANVEFREALTPQTLLAGAVVLGLVLGILVGVNASAVWDDAYLAWHGVTFGVTEPFLGHDLGLYVAQLPLWRAMHGAAVLVVLLALAATLTLYVVVGAVRWIGSRPAVNDHARAHLGWLLAAFGLVLAWGYLLEPYALVGGRAGPVGAGEVRIASFVAPALAGTAIMVSVLCALWAVRPRHTLMVAGWLVLLLAWAGGRLVLPALAGAEEPPGQVAVRQRVTELAYGLGDLETAPYRAAASENLPQAPVSFWDETLLPRLGEDGDEPPAATGRAVLEVPGGRRPIWLLIHSEADGGSVVALADDRVSVAGGPLFYRPGDSVPYPTPYAFLDLAPHAVRPGAPPRAIGLSVPGIAAGSWLRRMVLAWALQAPRLLGNTPADTRVAWHLEPTERLAALAPFAEWRDPMARIIAGRLAWLVDGYVAAPAFPLAPRARWDDVEIGYLRAGFVGLVWAESGETLIYLRPGADPVSRVWGDIAAGLVAPAGAMPSEVREALAYPAGLFETQSSVLEHGPWSVGRLVERFPGVGPNGEATGAGPVAWRSDTSGTLLVAGYEEPGGGRVGALLIGASNAGRRSLTLFQLDSALALPTPALLINRWNRFPLFEQLQDSVRASGGQLESGLVKFWLGGGTLAAYRPYFGVRDGDRPLLVWLSVAADTRLGAGRSQEEAVRNLRGTSVPAPFTPPRNSSLDEARRWVRFADSALRRGDWAAFGRAWTALKSVLELNDSTADSAAGALVPSGGED